MADFSTRLVLTGGLAGALMLLGSVAHAGPMLTFNLDQISDPSIGTGSLGTVLLAQTSSTVVDLKVSFSPDLIINSGGPHTPFVFNTALTGISVSFVTPVGGVAPHGTFTFSTLGGSEKPYGSFADAINYSGGTGSSSGYSGSLEFTVSRAGGISTTDFTGNDGGYFFAADLSNGTNTGGVATRGPGSVAVPEPASAALFGISILGLLGLVRGPRALRNRSIACR